MGSQMETWIQDCLYWMQQTLPTHWKWSYWKNKVMQHQGCSTWTTSGILEQQHTIQQSWEIHQPPCKFSNWKHYQWVKDEIEKLLMAKVPVLKAYPTCHSWIITAHVSLGNLEKQWRMFIRQMDRTQQILNSLLQEPLPPTHLISTLQAELTNLDSIYTSYRPLIVAATQPLKKEPSFDGVSASNKCTRRSLPPFLGDALSWLTGTAMTKDVNSIRKRVNQLIETQHN